MRAIGDYIISHDPDSLIILIGDHGAWRFRPTTSIGEWQFRPATSDTLPLHKETLKAQGISFQDFVDDIFGVIFAVRLPGGEYRDISHGLPMSHINLFRHVFAYLNNDPEILKNRVSSDSIFRDGTIFVRDGKPVSE